jgi:hypothetical protein
MPSLVYILCTLTSLMCAFLLIRGFWKTRVRLLLFSGLCFAGLTVENLILYLDQFVIHDTDLSFPPVIISLISRCVLLFGLIWSVR